MLARVRRWLGHPHLPLHVAVLAVLLCGQALTIGRLVDDHVHRAALEGLEGFPELERSPAELFSFVRSGSPELPAAIDKGLWPWWSAPDLRLAFYRPVSGYSHALDYALWPGSPALMHLHSLLWFGATVALAGLLFRRLIAPGWIAGLAALLFAVDDAHFAPAAWIANRNATIAAFFGLLTLWLHHRWRSEGWRAGAWLAPLALLCALFGNEGAVATGGYLLAYALFVDRGPSRSRFLSLAPCGALGAVWWLVYRGSGFGAHGSGVYVDPGATPIRFLAALAERAPVLLRGQLALPGADLQGLLSQSAGRTAWVASLGLLALLGLLFWPILRSDRSARFFGLGMLLSVVPAASTFPSDRLLFLTGFGAMGLLAKTLVWLAEDAHVALRRSVLPLLLCVHLVAAPAVLLLAPGLMVDLDGLFRRAAASIPSDPGVDEQAVWVVHTPSAFVTSYSPVLQALAGKRVPKRFFVLASSVHGLEVERPDERTLVLRPEGGLIPRPGTPRPGLHDPPALSIRYTFQMLDRLFRAEPPPPGTRFSWSGLAAEVLGPGPAAVRFRFDHALEDPTYRWMVWLEGRFAPFELPPIGTVLSLPPPALVPPSHTVSSGAS